MTAPTMPLVTVAPPVATQPGFGLYAAATVLDRTERPASGVQYEPVACGPFAHSWAITCGQDPPPPAKLLDGRAGAVTGEPFWVYLGRNCLDLDDLDDQARQALLLSEQRAVERTFWTGDQGNDPHLAASGAVVLAGSAAAAVSVTAGIAALESYLRANYDSLGIIHAPPIVASYASQQSVVWERSGRLTSVLGVPFAFGQGYAVNTGPDGVAAAAGTAWLYASGDVVVRRGPVRVPQTVEALNRTNNQVAMIAERPITVTLDCVLAAVRVELTTR